MENAKVKLYLLNVQCLSEGIPENLYGCFFFFFLRSLCNLFLLVDFIYFLFFDLLRALLQVWMSPFPPGTPPGNRTM